MNERYFWSNLLQHWGQGIDPFSSFLNKAPMIFKRLHLRQRLSPWPRGLTFLYDQYKQRLSSYETYPLSKLYSRNKTYKEETGFSVFKLLKWTHTKKKCNSIKISLKSWMHDLKKQKSLELCIPWWCIKLDIVLCCFDTFRGMAFLFQQDNPKLLSAGTLYSFATHMSTTVRMYHSWTSPALLSAHKCFHRKKNAPRLKCKVTLFFWDFCEVGIQSAANEPWRAAICQQTGLQQSSACGMPNICFICWKEEKKSITHFPPFPAFLTLRKGLFLPPVHFQHSIGEQK